jgi:hypothetical protein
MIDIGAVPHHQREMHKRLENWKRWAKPGAACAISPMFRTTFTSNSRQWHAPEHRETCDNADATMIEKAICKLPKDHREAICWWYLYPNITATKARKYFGQTVVGLDKLVVDSRQMLLNNSTLAEYA